jgi:hypothetical protein
MEHFNIPFIAGIVRDIHERIIPENKASNTNNVLFQNGKFKTRWGYASLGSTLYDSSPSDGGGVMAIIDYPLLDTGSNETIAITTSDAYRLNQNSGEWELITKRHNTGTVTVTATGGVAAAATGNWDTSNGTKYEIKFGTSDLTATITATAALYGATGDGLNGDWWKVSGAVAAAATGFNLVTATGTAVATAVSYVLRELWSGDADNIIDYAFPYDTASTDKVLIVTNGVEEVRKWAGGATTPFVDMDSSADIAKYVDYFGSVGSEHLILSNTTESSVEYTQRIKYTSAGRINTWGTRNNFYDFLNNNDKIMGIEELGGRLMVYKENSITELWADPNGGNDDPFNFNQNKIPNIGTPSIRTVANLGTHHIFFGSDNNIYAFDGVNVAAIGEEVTREIDTTIDRQYRGRSFAAHLKEEDLYCLFIPTAADASGFPVIAYVYSYRDKTWTKWAFAHSVTAFGRYNKTSDFSWNDWATGNAWNTKVLRWEDVKRIESQDRYLFGDSSGNIYQFEKQYLTDNGTNITTQLVTRDYPINDPKHIIRILEIVIGFSKLTNPVSATVITNTVKVETSVDFGENWSSPVSVTETWSGLSGDYTEHIYNFLQRGKQVRFRITATSNAYELENLLIGYNPSQQGKVK